MSEMTVLGLSVSSTPRLEQVVAIDTSVFVAADSFIAAAAGVLKDPYAGFCFDLVATAFCNDVRLYLPLPHTKQSIEPRTLQLWSALKQKTDVVELALTPDDLEDSGSELLDAFVVFVEGTSDPVARWLAFHFTTDLMRIYLGRASIDHIEQCSDLVAKLLEQRRIPQLVAAIEHHRREGLLTMPDILIPFVGTKFTSELHLGISYILSVFLRGWSYALGLAACDAQPSYQHHWLRAPALRANLAPNTNRVHEAQAAGWFPWGTILRRVFDPRDPLASRNHDRLQEVFSALREGATEFRANLATISDGKTSTRDRPSEAELLVLETLLRAGVAPRYKSSTRVERLAALLRGIGDVTGPTPKFVAELVASALQPEWARKREAGIRLTFRRSTIWDVFEDPGISGALDGGASAGQDERTIRP